MNNMLEYIIFRSITLNITGNLFLVRSRFALLDFLICFDKDYVPVYINLAQVFSVTTGSIPSNSRIFYLLCSEGVQCGGYVSEHMAYFTVSCDDLY